MRFLPKIYRKGDACIATPKKIPKLKTKINPDAKIGKIQVDPEGTKYRCTCCGTFFTKQKGNFSASRSHLFSGNNGYVSICKSCTDVYYKMLVEYFSGNEDEALERMCSLFDWYFAPDIAASSKRGSIENTSVSRYPSQLQLNQNVDRGDSFLCTIRDRANENPDIEEKVLGEIESNTEEEKEVIPPEYIKKWGFGFKSLVEYQMLDELYADLTKQIVADDVIQRSLIKSLCTTKTLENRAFLEHNMDDYLKLTKLYQDTIKTANMKPNSSAADTLSDEQTVWGNFVKNVEDYSPAEIYKDKKLFADFDEIKKYFDRFIVRPFKNYFTGSSEMDKEYVIPMGGDGNESR